jgi:GNAT superfamily N-acetyltransferase
MRKVAVRRMHNLTEVAIAQLADVLVDCVAGGASVGFMHPLPKAQAEAFWRGLAADMEAGRRILFTAEDEAGIVGTVQLMPASFDNQPHRADIAKMLVHRRGRRRGVGTALVRTAEKQAREMGRWLLVLDTVPGTDAERLYRHLGWQPSGIVPDYALMPDGALTDTHFFYRNLNQD